MPGRGRDGVPRRAPLVDAGASGPRTSAAESGSDGDSDGSRGQRVADIDVGSGLREDDPADRSIGKHQWPAAVASVDLRPELEDLAGDPVLTVDFTTLGRIAAGDGCRLNDEEAAARE